MQKIPSEKGLLNLDGTSSAVLPDPERCSVALKVIKDIGPGGNPPITCWIGAGIALEPFIKDVCREFNMVCSPSASQWISAFKLLKSLREMSVFFFFLKEKSTQLYAVFPV